MRDYKELKTQNIIAKLKKLPHFIVAFSLAIASILLACLLKRPYSGIWLARYFLKLGGRVTLPRKFEKILRKDLQFAKLELTPNEYCTTDSADINADFITHKEKTPSNSCYSLYFREALFCRDKEWIIYYEPDNCTSKDFNTTVGTMIVRSIPPAKSFDDLIEAKTFQYIDVYNWHNDANWCISVENAILPFNIWVTGNDCQWQELGQDFVTLGYIYLED